MPHSIDSAKLAIIQGWLGSGSINIFGRPFAGKDTQGQRLAYALGAPLLGGGDILRGSVIPEDVRASMEAGELVPTQTYLDIVLPYLQQPDFADKPLILNSVGRWHGEEPGVQQATAAAKHPLRVAIVIDVEEETVYERWEANIEDTIRGDRQDDKLEPLRLRLVEFKNKTLPVLDYYQNHNLLIRVAGNTDPDIVTNEIIDNLTNRANTLESV